MDLVLTIDGLILDENESVDDYVNKIEEITNSNYPIVVEVNHIDK